MACCYIAASMIAFIIRSCDALDINLNLQYNESVAPKHVVDDDFASLGQDEAEKGGLSGITVISVSGMTCAACVTNVERALSEVQGVEKALVNLALQEARIFHGAAIDRDQIIQAVEAAGYDASLGERPPAQKIETLKHTEELSVLRSSLRGLAFHSTAIFALGKSVDYVIPQGALRLPGVLILRSLVLLGLTLNAVTRHGGWIMEKAAQAARQGRANMHTLIAASTTVGIVLSVLDISCGTNIAQYYDTILGTLLIITVGHYMDLLSRRQASNTFLGLYSLVDETSSVKLASIQKRVPSHVVRSGDEILIEPYSMIPCDSYVVEGASHANEAIVTGESNPKIKNTGDLLLAGSRNGPNQLRAMVHQDPQGSFLSHLVKSIESALTSKASAQHRVDKVTQYFVSTIFLLATVSSSWDFLSASSHGLVFALQIAGRKMMTILAAACPCALGLATPCAVMAGIDVAWRKGILMLQGGETMELVQGITHVVMDKTGTLTQGTPTVTNMIINPAWQGREAELAVLLCAAEEESIGTHPLASAVFRKLLPLAGDSWQKFQIQGAVRNAESISGRGIKCEVSTGDGQWRSMAVGSLEHLAAAGIAGLESMKSESLTEGSVVFASVDGQLAASIVLQDTAKPDAKDTVAALKARSIEVSILTGDNPAEASRIAQELGIRVAASQATPDDKLKHIRELQAQGHKVVMVGDGMNDGPSFAAAEVGVMMAHGKHCLSSGGSVLILHSQLKSLVTLLDISQRTMWQVSANISWAMAYNVVAVGLAIGLGAPFSITVTPPVAATMMSISSVLITLSGIFLRARLSQQHGVGE